MKKLLLAVVLIIATAAIATAAPRATGVEALERLRQTFAGINDFTAEITQEKQLSIMKKKMVSTGIVKFRQPDLFFMELNPPYASRMVLRDNILDLLVDRNRQHMVLPGDGGLRRWTTLLSKPVTAIPEGVDVRSERQGDQETITIIPSAGQQVSSFILSLGGDARLKRLQINEKNGNRTTISFRRMKTNVGLKDADFRLDP